MSDQTTFRADIDLVRKQFKRHVPFGQALQAMRMYNGDIVSACMHIADERCPPLPKQTSRDIDGNWRRQKSPI